MAIDQFLKVNDIDVRALERIKHRLFVVGRFNQRNKGEYPDIYLFTNRQGFSATYRDNFTNVVPMQYENFVHELRPAIAEKIETSGRIPMVIQEVPQNDEAQDAASVIDTFNFFFQRAVVNSDQEAFNDSQAGLPKELLRADEEERGKGIFQLIRKNLNVFSEFQPRTYELVEAVSRLLGSAGRAPGMPPYAAGGPLPGGFPERFIDYLYAEDSRRGFTTEGLDFSAEPWPALGSDSRARDMFCNVVTAFRDALLGSQSDQFTDIQIRGKTLSQQARDSVPGNLSGEFRRAREAYNGLRQILRSKVLLSMVLEWLLKAYYQIPAVQEAGSDDYSRDRAVENAILRDWERNGLAKPVRRASSEERRKFSRELTANFERLITAVLAEEAARESAMEALPDEIRSLAESIRNDPSRRTLLAGLAGPAGDGEQQRAFVEASKVVLLDVLCPALFQEPMLSEQMLRQFFRRETMAAYLTAVYLAKRSQDDIRRIAEKRLDLFQQKISPELLTIRDVGEIQALLLGDFVDVLARPELHRRLTEGLRVLADAHTILEHVSPDAVGNHEIGAGQISAIFPDPEYVKAPALARTTIPTEAAVAPIATFVASESQRQVGALLEKIVAAPSTVTVSENVTSTASLYATADIAGGAPAGASYGSAASDGAGGESEDLPASVVEGGDGIDPVVESPLEREVTGEVRQAARSAIDRVLSKLSADPEERRKEMERAKREVPSQVALEAEKRLTDTPGFLENVKSELRAYEQTLHLIYQRYNENPDKKTFRNRVERMTLVNMMLLFRRELGLGQVSSNLYHLLLDMVEHLDPEKPEPRAFLAEKSLTIYFDNEVLDEGGMTDLRETLIMQAFQNLQATVDFVSELRGIKYLMDTVKGDPDAEIVVVNATAEEFLKWLRADNLADVPNGRMRLQSGRLVTNGQISDTAIPPGLVYLTDSAFGGTTKVNFLRDLEQFRMHEGDLSVLLPPMCLSTRYPAAAEPGWMEEGRMLATMATNAPAPVTVVGPSFFMNKRDDAFKTYLPAGYAFAAHFLRRPEQRLQNRFVPVQSSGRFRVLGFGAAPMRESLDRTLWSQGEEDTYAFAVDFYLYIVLTVLATAIRRGGVNDVNIREYLRAFHYQDEVLDTRAYKSTQVLSGAMIGGDALRFALAQNLAAEEELREVTLRRPEPRDARPQRITDVVWFNHARRNAGLV